MFDKLYDLSEQSQVNFVGFVSEFTRYDFSIVYTKEFFGKPLVICMQTGRSSLMCYDDLTNLDHLQRVFNIKESEQARELSTFLKQRIPVLPYHEQY
jgi:hypothetical protein